ncbi:MAG: DivIVA domain-containing protein [Bacillota bacterium]|jgi:cell division initiation protein
MALTDDSNPTGADFHRLSPLDIHNKEFTKSFRGYNEDEVDEFLDLVVAEFERLVRTNEELQAEISGLEAKLEHYRGLEETLKNAIVLAQKTADEIKESSHREADAIRRQAQLDADRIRDQANESLKKSYEEIDAARQALLRFRAEFKSFLQTTGDMLDAGTEKVLQRLGDKN